MLICPLNDIWIIDFAKNKALLREPRKKEYVLATLVRKNHVSDEFITEQEVCFLNKLFTLSVVRLCDKDVQAISETFVNLEKPIQAKTRVKVSEDPPSQPGTPFSIFTRRHSSPLGTASAGSQARSLVACREPRAQEAFELWARQSENLLSTR